MNARRRKRRIAAAATAAAQTTKTSTMRREHSEIVCLCVWVWWDKKLANVRNERSRSPCTLFHLHWGVRFICVCICVHWLFYSLLCASLPLCPLPPGCVCVCFRLFFWTIRYRRPNNAILLQLQHCECLCVFVCESRCAMRIFTFYYSSLCCSIEECVYGAVLKQIPLPTK